MNYEIKEFGDNAMLTIKIVGITLESAVEIVNLAKKSLGMSELDKTIINLIKNEGLLQAVKYHKNQTGMGLKESKDYCDELKAQYC